MAIKNTKSPYIDGLPPILQLSFKVIGGPPVTGTPVEYPWSYSVEYLMKYSQDVQI